MARSSSAASYTLILICYLIFILYKTSHGESSIGTGKSYYTAKERKALEKFRLLVEPELYRSIFRTDEFLIRWIRDQNFNLEKAREKLIKSLKWRKENKIDSILNEDFSQLQKLCPYSLDAKDKSGRPVMIIDVGRCSIRKIVLRGQAEELKRLSYYFFELAFRNVSDLQQKGEKIEDFLAILDYNGFNFREHTCIACMPSVIEILLNNDANYPRLIYKSIGINAPKLVENFFEVVRPFMSEYLQSINHIYGYDNAEWKRVILNSVDADQLSTKYGGSRKN